MHIFLELNTHMHHERSAQSAISLSTSLEPFDLQTSICSMNMFNDFNDFNVFDLNPTL
jgi:hypothetical protein